MPKISALKPDPEKSLFICKVYFDRPNFYDPTQDHQKRFFSFDYPNERKEPPTLEEFRDDKKMLQYNGFFKMMRWIEKARQDSKFKHAYIYANQIQDESGKPMEIRLLLPYKSETNEQVLQNLCKPSWKESIFKLIVYYQPDQENKPDGYGYTVHYSRDLDIERENPITSVQLTKKMKKYRGFQYLSQKHATIKQHPRWKMSILYANLLGKEGEEIARVS